MGLKPIYSEISTDILHYDCDIFCQVIDNFGDAGVCLRLAKQLTIHYGLTVRLWCDALPLLMQLEPMAFENLSFYDWNEQVKALPALMVICGFGCTLSEPYLKAMANLDKQPKYIHLDYLSAESWVETTHGLYAIHPRLGLKQWFYNPGFNQNTGGLLMPCVSMPLIKNQPMHLNSVLFNFDKWNTSLMSYSYDCIQRNASINPIKIFCFAYDLPILQVWIMAVKQFAIETQCMIQWVLPDTAASTMIYRSVYNHDLHQCICLPFVSQTQFDATLNGCDLVWVRGEDSAMTALFSGLPMLWQLYPQTDSIAKDNKLTAYLNTVQQAVGVDWVWSEAMRAANHIDYTPESVSSGIAAFKLWLYQVKQPSMVLNYSKFAEYCRQHVPNLAYTVFNYFNTD